MRTVCIKLLHTPTGKERMVTAQVNYLGDSISLLESAINDLYQRKYSRHYCLLYWYLL